MLRALGRQFDYSKYSVWLFTFFVTSQCASLNRGAVVSEAHMRPLQDIRKAVYSSFKGNIKRKSQNGRTYFSEFHKPGTNLARSSLNQKERAQLIVTILGDRRPYQLSVSYEIFKLSGGEYKTDRYDKKLARYYLNSIEEYLASRPEERDVIDDFRPY